MGAMAPRSIWRGSISFGLVSVPIRIAIATESNELRFHFLHKDDLVPIGYDKVERTQKNGSKKPARRAKSKRAAAR